MRRGSSKGTGTLLLFLLSGIIVGTIVGKILAGYFPYEIFTHSYAIGTQGPPAIIDLSILQIAFGLTLFINFGTVVGLLLGIFFYSKA